MHKNNTNYVLKCTDNHVISCINCMLLEVIFINKIDMYFLFIFMKSRSIFSIFFGLKNRRRALIITCTRRRTHSGPSQQRKGCSPGIKRSIILHEAARMMDGRTAVDASTCLNVLTGPTESSRGRPHRPSPTVGQCYFYSKGEFEGASHRHLSYK